jgi:hypothetical protein
VSDSRDVKSHTAAYHLFSQGGDSATVLLGVSYLTGVDKKTNEAEKYWYGIYWSPDGENNPFRVYHCSKTTRWLTEHGSDSLPVFIRMERKDVNGKEVYNPTFVSMDLATQEWMWDNVIPRAWKSVMEEECKEFLPQ